MTRLRDAIEIREEEGKMALFGHRFWLAHSAEFVSLRSALEQIMGRAADGLVYHEGEQTGAAYMQLIQSALEDQLRGRDLRGQADLYLEWLSRIGYGRFRIDEFDSARGVARITLQDSIEAESYGTSKAPACHTISGILGQLAGTLWGRTARSNETACKSKGADACDFVIEVSE